MTIVSIKNLKSKVASSNTESRRNQIRSMRNTVFGLSIIFVAFTLPRASILIILLYFYNDDQLFFKLFNSFTILACAYHIANKKFKSTLKTLMLRTRGKWIENKIVLTKSNINTIKVG